MRCLFTMFAEDVGLSCPKAASPGPSTAEEVARSFKGAAAAQVADLLETLAALGQARRAGEGRYGAG